MNGIEMVAGIVLYLTVGVFPMKLAVRYVMPPANHGERLLLAVAWLIWPISVSVLVLIPLGHLIELLVFGEDSDVRADR